MTDLLIGRENSTGRITLNRPEALNALTWEMALEIEKTLRAWQDDPEIEQVLIDATGERAFCAGGDIVSIYEEGKHGEADHANQFWRDEYRLNALIARYPKPFIAIMDGFVMGGGVGISAHGSHRIVTERTQFAMPECSIGLIPDVGGSYLLANMPGFLGEFAGLTGARLNGADCLFTGIGSHFVAGERLEELKAALITSGLDVLNDFAERPEMSSIEQDQGLLDACFSKDTLPEIIEACQGGEVLDKAARGLAKGSPLSLLVALRTIRAARKHQSLEEALKLEFRFTSRSILLGDFIEGIRAAVIDKDRQPQWRYATVEDILPEILHKMEEVAELGDVSL